MVDTSLNKKYTASAGGNSDFSPIPDGEYHLKVIEIKPWEKKTQDVMVIKRDENGKALVDEKGSQIREKVSNCEFYNSTVKLSVVGGQYDGRLIFYNLTTHPNMSFAIPNFLYGIGEKDMAASDIPTKAIDKLCLADVITDTYDKKKTDKDTGLETIEKKTVNRVKSFKKPDEQVLEANGNEPVEDLGI